MGALNLCNHQWDSAEGERQLGKTKTGRLSFANLPKHQNFYRGRLFCILHVSLKHFIELFFNVLTNKHTQLWQTTESFSLPSDPTMSWSRLASNSKMCTVSCESWAKSEVAKGCWTPPSSTHDQRISGNVKAKRNISASLLWGWSSFSSPKAEYFISPSIHTRPGQLTGARTNVNI